MWAEKGLTGYPKYVSPFGNLKQRGIKMEINKFVRIVFLCLSIIVGWSQSAFCADNETNQPAIQCDGYIVESPRICDIDSTIKLLRESNMSFARFSDGEFRGILEKYEPFQKPSKALSLRLKEILSSKNPNVMIGIPSPLFSLEGYKEDEVEFWTEYKPIFMPLLEKLNADQVYFPSEISALSERIKSQEGMEAFFSKIRTIWQDKDVHLIRGKGIFDGFKYDIFDNAKSVTYQIAPNRDAFERYDVILAEALRAGKGKLIIIVLGPTATVLAYDLGVKGYKALDMGHIAKAYDRYKRGWKDPRFWMPD